MTRSITEFPLRNERDAQHIGLLPDFWVGGEKLYQYQTLDDGERRGYVLTYHKLMDPYRYAEDNTSLIMRLL